MIKELRPSDIKYLVVHCSDSPQGRGDNAQTIHRWHVERGFDCIGYHKVILEDGTIEDGRPEYIRGAHVKNYNWCSLGVCLIGDSSFKYEQISSMNDTLWRWMDLYPNAKPVSHSDLDASKTCPNFELGDYWTQEVYRGN